MEIREATRADAGLIGDLCAQLGYPATSEEVGRRLEQIGQGRKAIVYVAEGASGQVVGWVHAFVRDLLVVDRHAELGGLIVDEALRGCGVGRRLMAQVEAWAAGQGCETVYVRSSVVREEAHGFYRSAGYDLIKSSHLFLKELTEGHDSGD
jgi:GNAT superfamily N-acetyltransferase